MVKPYGRVTTANWQMFLPLLAIELHWEWITEQNIQEDKNFSNNVMKKIT